MNIVIISYYYSPGNLMGAIRASKLSKYLNLLNANVSVIASKDNKWLFLDMNVKNDETLVIDTAAIPVHRVLHSKPYQLFAYIIKICSRKFINNQSTNNSTSSSIKKNWGIKLFLNIIVKSSMKFMMFFAGLVQDFDFMFKYMFSSKEKHKFNNADVIISSYGPHASHLVGLYIKLLKGKRVKWVADFRDPISQPTDLWLQRKINKYFEYIVCKKADYIVAVSEGYLDKITGNKYQEKKMVITNGYDKSDIEGITNSEPTKKLTFSYTGTTYNGRRDLSPLFTVLKELIEDGLINKNFVSFTYAGPEQQLIQSLADQFEISSIFQIYKQQPRLESLKLNLNATILIVATWDDVSHTGVLPGKLFELMVFNKPIIALVNGHLSNSEIFNLVNSYNLGFCYENANKVNDIVLLKQYVLKQYNNYIGQGKLIFNPNEKLVSNHDYSNIALKYSKLIQKLCSIEKTSY